MVLPFDEVDALISAVRQQGEAQTIRREDGGEPIPRPFDAEALIDSVQELLVLDYVYGVQSAAEMLGVEIEPDMEQMQEAIELRIAGENFRDRLRKYADSGDTESIVRVIDTDSTRVFNSGIVNGGTKAGATHKTWQTMRDDRVRDTHEYLEGLTVPIDAEFITFDGDSAQAPGGFLLPQNNINCRCVLTIS